MAMTAPPSAAVVSMEMEGVVGQPAITGSITGTTTTQGGGGARRQTDIIDVDANDSGNELSMGGSSSEGDSMSHHRGEHSPNQHHHSDSLLVGSQGGLGGNVFPPFTGSLFDTPPSLLSSPHHAQFHHLQQQRQQQQQQNVSFSPISGFGGSNGMNDAFRCAVCSQIGRNGGNGASNVFQFVCAHKTCQSCCQQPNTFEQHRQSCAVCGALPATAVNFPPQMFLSPTLTTPPGDLLLDTGPAKSANSSTPQAPRAFSFSLNGLSGSPSPLIPRMSTPVSAGVMMRSGGFASPAEMESTWSPATGYHHHQAPSQLTINNLPSIIGNQHQNSPMMSNVFDSLTVNDDTPVFSPLSPTNTSSHMPPSLMASPQVPRHSAIIAQPRASIFSTPRLSATSPSSLILLILFVFLCKVEGSEETNNKKELVELLELIISTNINNNIEYALIPTGTISLISTAINQNSLYIETSGCSVNKKEKEKFHKIATRCEMMVVTAGLEERPIQNVSIHVLDEFLNSLKVSEFTVNNCKYNDEGSIIPWIIGALLLLVLVCGLGLAVVRCWMTRNGLENEEVTEPNRIPLHSAPSRQRNAMIGGNLAMLNSPPVNRNNRRRRSMIVLPDQVNFVPNNSETVPDDPHPNIRETTM